MIRVALVTTWPPEDCGIASHSWNIVEHTKCEDIEFTIIKRPFSHDQILEQAKDWDIIHVSYEFGLHGHIHPNWVDEWKRLGKKTVCTFHNIWPDDGSYPINFPQFTQQNSTVERFDAVVTQDPDSRLQERGWVYIPQGVLGLEDEFHRVGTICDNVIGTAGFPAHPLSDLNKKGTVLAAQLARELGMGLLLFAPDRPSHYPGYANEVEKLIRGICPKVEVIKTFETQQHIVNRLGCCMLTFWGYASHDNQSGISGSVRLGIGARRPLMVTRCGMYRDIFDDPGVHAIPSDRPTLVDALPVARELLSNPRYPTELADRMSWIKCGEMYRTLYRRLMA